jgi:hypothetical protein
VQVFAAGCAGDGEFPLDAKRCFFTLQYRAHGLETCRIKPWIAAVEFDDELIARAWKRDENKIGVQDRDQCGKNAVTDLARIVVLPRCGKCRERDETADAPPQLILVCNWLQPRHYRRLDVHSQRPGGI